MSAAKHTPGPCPITPARLRWLQHLAKQTHKGGEVPWSRMPARENGLGACTSQTWRPMVDAGLITQRFGQRHFTEPVDHLFAITDAGRAAIAKATGGAQ